MSIDRKAGETPPPAQREWRVHVAVSVIRIVPKNVLDAWMACESFQRDQDHFWPDNRALAVCMGVGPITSVQRLLLRLEHLGILERRAGADNHRTMALRRRTHESITPVQWTAMEMQAEARRKAPSFTSQASGRGTSWKR